jgi:hypothetical protein
MVIAVLRGKLVALNAYNRKHLSFCAKKPGKKEKLKSKISMKKIIIKKLEGRHGDTACSLSS